MIRFGLRVSGSYGNSRNHYSLLGFRHARILECDVKRFEHGPRDLGGPDDQMLKKIC